VAAQLGRPGLTFVAWVLGGALSFLGALVFAELATRLPQAGGKYLYAREAFGRRAGFVIGWIEGLSIYSAAIAAVGVVSGEYLARLLSWDPSRAPVLGLLLIAAFTGLNLVGVGAGRITQNAVTAAKVAALFAVVIVAAAAGKGAGWGGALAGAPTGWAAWGALAVAFQAVIWTYYGYPDAAKIAEEVDDPDRRLPRIFLYGILTVTLLYLLLNAAFLQVLSLERIAASNLVAADVAAEVFGERAGVLMAGLALLVVLASLNGNLFVTPRVIFGLSREGLGPAFLARVNDGGTPWTATLLIGATSLALAATGTFEHLLALAITLILLTDGFMVLVLFRLRRRGGRSAFTVPLYPALPLAFLLTYAALFVGAAAQQPWATAQALGVLALASLLSRLVVR
jgi:APA family basic amino acid/polyamine antiporter